MIRKRLPPILFTFGDELGGATPQIATGDSICGRANNAAAVSGSVCNSAAIVGRANADAAIAGNIKTNCC